MPRVPDRSERHNPPGGPLKAAPVPEGYGTVLDIHDASAMIREALECLGCKVGRLNRSGTRLAAELCGGVMIEISLYPLVERPVTDPTPTRMEYLDQVEQATLAASVIAALEDETPPTKVREED